MTDAQYPPIAFIGAGNMAYSLISGLRANHYPANKIFVSNPRPEKLKLLHQEFNLSVFADNIEAAQQAQILVLAVKPQTMKTVVQELSPTIIQHRPLIISIAAGISIAKLTEWIGSQAAIVRCMPNIASYVQSGTSGMYANAAVTPLQRDLSENILRAVGLTLWLENEKLIHAVAALSGSGPAYFFLVMEAMETAGIALGLRPDDARILTLQTALGSAKFILSTDEAPAALRARVTSKGGTTECAVRVMEEANISEIFKKALQVAYQKSLKLAEEII